MIPFILAAAIALSLYFIAHNQGNLRYFSSRSLPWVSRLTLPSGPLLPETTLVDSEAVPSTITSVVSSSEDADVLQVVTESPSQLWSFILPEPANALVSYVPPIYRSFVDYLGEHLVALLFVGCGVSVFAYGVHMVAASLTDISTAPSPARDNHPDQELDQVDATTDVRTSMGPEDESSHTVPCDALPTRSTMLSNEESRDDGDETNDTQSSLASSNATLLTPLSLDLDLGLEPDHWKADLDMLDAIKFDVAVENHGVPAASSSPVISDLTSPSLPKLMSSSSVHEYSHKGDDIGPEWKFTFKSQPVEAGVHPPSAAVQPPPSLTPPSLLDDLTQTEPTRMNASSPFYKLVLCPQDPCDFCTEPAAPSLLDPVALPVSTVNESLTASPMSGEATGEDESAALLAYLEQLDRQLDEEEEKGRMASSSPPTDSIPSPSVSTPALPKEGCLSKQKPSVQANQTVPGPAMFGPSLSDVPHKPDSPNWANAPDPDPSGTLRARTRTSKQAITGLFEPPLDVPAKDAPRATARGNWVDKPMTLEMVAGIDPQSNSRKNTSLAPPSMPPSTQKRNQYLSSPSAPQDFLLSPRTSLPLPHQQQQRRGKSMSSLPQQLPFSEVPRRPPIQTSEFSSGVQASMHNPSNSMPSRPPFTVTNNTSLPPRPESKPRPPLSGGVATSIHNPNYKPVGFQPRSNSSALLSQNQHSLPHPPHQYQSVHSGGQNVPPFQPQPKAALVAMTTPFANRPSQSPLLPSPFPRDGVPPSHNVSSQPLASQPISGGFNGSASSKPFQHVPHTPPSMTPPANGNLPSVSSPLLPHPPLSPQPNFNRNNSTHVVSRPSPPQRLQSVSTSVSPLSAGNPLSHPAPPTSKGVIRFLPPPPNHPLPPKPNLTVPSRIPTASARSTALPFLPPTPPQIAAQPSSTAIVPLTSAKPPTAQTKSPLSRGASLPIEETIVLPPGAHVDLKSPSSCSNSVDGGGCFDRPKSAMDSFSNLERQNNSHLLLVDAQTRTIETQQDTSSQQGTRLSRRLRPVRSLEHFGKPWLAVHAQTDCAQSDRPGITLNHRLTERGNSQDKQQPRILPTITLDVDSGLPKYNHRVSSLPSLKLQT